MELLFADKTIAQDSLREFITGLDESYLTEIKKIALFTSASHSLSKEQKKVFVKVFYHLRGHFHEFLWILGNFAPNPELKSIVVKNIEEEFGLRCSHEELYIRFANALEVDIIKEIVDEEHYLPFANDFNYGHKKWLMEHSWNSKMCAFAAYERLDNVDYPNLFDFAKGFNISESALAFFRVHTAVTHFENTEAQIAQIWHEDKMCVINAFYFIYGHQLQMWRQLSEIVFSYEKDQIKNTAVAFN